MRMLKIMSLLLIITLVLASCGTADVSYDDTYKHITYAIVDGTLPGIFTEKGFQTLDGKVTVSATVPKNYILVSASQAVGALKDKTLVVSYGEGAVWHVKTIKNVEYTVPVHGCLGVSTYAQTERYVYYKVCKDGVKKTDKVPLFGIWATPSETDPVYVLDTGETINIGQVAPSMMGAVVIRDIYLLPPGDYQWVVPGKGFYVLENEVGLYIVREDGGFMGPYEVGSASYTYLSKDRKSIYVSTGKGLLVFTRGGIKAYDVPQGIIVSSSGDKVKVLTDKVSEVTLKEKNMPSPLHKLYLGQGVFIDLPKEATGWLNGGAEVTSTSFIIGDKVIEGTYTLEDVLPAPIMTGIKKTVDVLDKYYDVSKWKVIMGSMEGTFPYFEITFPAKVPIDKVKDKIISDLQSAGLRQMPSGDKSAVAQFYIPGIKVDDNALWLYKDEARISVLVLKKIGR